MSDITTVPQEDGSAKVKQTSRETAKQLFLMKLFQVDDFLIEVLRLSLLRCFSPSTKSRLVH